MNERKGSHYLRLLLALLVLTVAASLVILIIGLFAKWSTSTQFSDGFFIGGVIAIALSFLSALGGFKQRTDFKIIYSQSAGDASLTSRTRRMMKDIRQGYGVLILLGGTAALLIGISVMIGHFG